MVQRTRKVNWSSKAKSQKKEILKYWINRNKSNLYSKKLNTLFNEKAIAVSENPFIGRKTKFEDVRVVIVRDNLMIYKIFEENILIVSIWEGHQNPENLEI